MTSANHVIIFDLSWNPVDDEQAVGRIYRYGQTNPCFTYRLVNDDSMDKAIYDRQIAKTILNRRVVDKKRAQRNERDDKPNLFANQPRDHQTVPLQSVSIDCLDTVDDALFGQLSRESSHLLTVEPVEYKSLIRETGQIITEEEKNEADKAYEQYNNKIKANISNSNLEATSSKKPTQQQKSNFRWTMHSSSETETESDSQDFFTQYSSQEGEAVNITLPGSRDTSKDTDWISLEIEKLEKNNKSSKSDAFNITLPGSSTQLNQRSLQEYNEVDEQINRIKANLKSDDDFFQQADRSHKERRLSIDDYVNQYNSSGNTTPGYVETNSNLSPPPLWQTSSELRLNGSPLMKSALEFQSIPSSSNYKPLQNPALNTPSTSEYLQFRSKDDNHNTTQKKITPKSRVLEKKENLNSKIKDIKLNPVVSVSTEDEEESSEEIVKVWLYNIKFYFNTK